jgi:6-phosphogluconate dehydrogenase
MVNAGKPVDDVLDQLMPLLSEGDTVMDGGNSNYKDTVVRQALLATRGLHFVGAGISGGEEGAFLGPSIMPGGSRQGYENLKDVLDAIAAKNEQGEVCCGYIGEGGAGHFVKMVHNGIEYAEMALIAEVYTHLRQDVKMPVDEIAGLFSQWNNSPLGNYLLEITADILRRKDSDGEPLLDKILDQAGAKGTGGWTTIAAAELGVPIPSMAEALFARFASSMPKQRSTYSSVYPSGGNGRAVPGMLFLYQFCRLMNHHQGMNLIKAASDAHQWNIDTSSLLRIWSGGCIIRSQLLQILRKGWDDADGDVLLHPYTVSFVDGRYGAVTEAMAALMSGDNAYPVMSASLQYFKAMKEYRSNAYMIQAQRDYFGAHTYQRVDDPGGAAHHTEWNKT